MKGTILMSRKGKLLLLADNRYYIVQGVGAEGESIEFQPEQALAMPSYLFAIAAIEEENLDQTLSFIQEKWFRHQK